MLWLRPCLAEPAGALVGARVLTAREATEGDRAFAVDDVTAHSRRLLPVTTRKVSGCIDIPWRSIRHVYDWCWRELTRTKFKIAAPLCTEFTRNSRIDSVCDILPKSARLALCDHCHHFTPPHHPHSCDRTTAWRWMMAT